MTAGVSASDALDTEKALVVLDAVAAGRAAGTTTPVWVDVQPRPWHTLEDGAWVEFPVAAGRPFTWVVLAADWALPWSPWLSWLPDWGVVVVDGVVVADVVVVPVVVGLVVVSVVVAPVVPVAPAATFVVVPVGAVLVPVVVVGVVFVGAGVVAV